MKTIFPLVCCTFILFGLNDVSTVFGVTAQTLLTEIQNRYENTIDFEASFVQESVGKIMRTPQKGAGKVYFKKKGMMRWDYQTPNQKLISDGRTLWYYQPEENQVLVYDLTKVSRERTPWAFLAGEGDLGRDFNVLNYNESISQKEENYVLELAPKEPQPDLAKLILTVDKKTYNVVQADVVNELGSVTRTRFLDIKTNLALPSSFFQFTIPPGTEVLKFKEPLPPPSGGKGPPSK